MIRALELTENEAQTPKLRDRLAVLDQIFRIAKEADKEQALWISARLQELARPWESAGWLMHAAQMDGQLRQHVPDLNTRHAAIVAWEQGGTNERIRDARLERMLGFKIDQWPMPRLEAAGPAVSRDLMAEFSQGLQFADIAAEVKIATQFDSGFPLDGGAFSLTRSMVAAWQCWTTTWMVAVTSMSCNREAGRISRSDQLRTSSFVCCPISGSVKSPDPPSRAIAVSVKASAQAM